MIFIGVLCSGLGEEEKDLVLSFLGKEKELDTLVFEGYKRSVLAFPKGQKQ